MPRLLRYLANLWAEPGGGDRLAVSCVGGVILEAEPNVDLVGVTHVFDALGRVIQERGLDALEFLTV